MNLLLKKTVRSGHATGSIGIVAACLLLALSGGCRVETPPESTTPNPTTSDVPASVDSAKTSVVIVEIFTPAGNDTAAKTDSDAADYTETFAVSKGTTLEEVMRKVKRPEIVITGSGETAFVKSIDGVAPSASRGWTFTIDDQFSNVGIGSVKLSPPQTVRWRFTSLDEATE